MNERRGREYWSEQVAEWRGSGLSKRAYCERHGVPYWSLCRWAGKLSPTPPGQRLVELELIGGGNVEQGAAIELVVGERYVLRQDRVGFALYQSQVGLKHRDAKPLRGLEANVLAVAARHDGDTYRAAYTVQFEADVYILHAFQKKAKRGIATPKQEIDLVKTEAEGSATTLRRRVSGRIDR